MTEIKVPEGGIIHPDLQEKCQVHDGQPVQEGAETIEGIRKRLADAMALNNKLSMTLAEQSRRAEAALEKKKNCTCPPERYRKKRFVMPNYKAGSRIMNKAKEKSIQEKREKEREKKEILQCVKEMLTSAVTSLANTPEKLDEVSGSIVQDLLSKKEISIHDIAEIFHDHETKLNANVMVAKRVTSNLELLAKLAKLLKAKRPVEPYVMRMIHYGDDIRTTNIPAIWHEKATSDETSEERIATHRKFYGAARDANEWSATFFHPYDLHPSIRANNNLSTLSIQDAAAEGILPDDPETLRGLCDIVRTTLPTDPERYDILRSAIAKIHLMHLSESISSQIDFDETQVAFQHIKQMFEQHYEKTPDGKCLLNPEADPKDRILVELVDFADPKSRIACARKNLDKDPETNRNFELSEIFDRLRMRIMLRKEHMTNPEKRDGVIKQIISYVCGILGTDISETRLRYSFGSGGTNGNSTGKHQAMHFTSRVRYECDSNPSMRTINLEVQIHGYMNSKEIDDDHNVYVGKKDARTTRMLGMDVPFQDFVEDLCDAILSDEDFADTNKITRKTFEFPLREKMARILFGILTKLDLENGLLKNGRIISEMLKDERKAKKLRKVIEIYKGAEAASVAYVRTGLQRMQGRVATIGTLDGWRGNIQEQIAVATEGKNVRTSLNILAEKAEDTINELERYASRPPAPVASMIVDDEFFGDGGWNEKNN